MRYPLYAICYPLIILLLALSGCPKRPLSEPTIQMDAEPSFWIRVLLLENLKDCDLKVDSSFAVVDPYTQTELARFSRSHTPIKVRLSEAKITIADRTFIAGELIILPDEPHIFSLNGDKYRGKLRLIINPKRTSFAAINLVPLEPYLAGVVGAEMPDYWEAAAINAQTIAARTYCLYIKNRFGQGRTWDVAKTQANQVYRGVAAESPRVWNAVNKTKGQVLMCIGPDGTKNIFPTYYCSTCGGHTENSRNVFGDSFTPLLGVPCDYCKNVAKPKYFFWPMVQLKKTDVTTHLLQRYSQLKKLGKIKNITPVAQSDYEQFSRLTRIKLTGSTGKTDSIRAEDLRLSLDPTGRKLRSTICKIANWDDKWAFLSGRGWGHGVGMCQCGAEGMARQGKTASQILSYYYPSSEILSIY